MEIETKRTIRFEGKHCGAGGKDCEFEGSNDQDTVCGAFQIDQGGAVLEGDPEDDDAGFLRCKECLEYYGKDR